MGTRSLDSSYPKGIEEDDIIQPYVPGQPSYVNLPPSETEIENTRISGVIKKYFPEKEFGFITCADSKKDVYFSLKEINTGIPKIGMKVRFSIRKSLKGDKAVSIRI